MVKKSFIDNPAISNVVFYPRKTPIPQDLEANIKVLQFQISKNIIIGGFFYLNNQKLPTILLFHGNGEVAIEYRYFLDIFFECDVNLAVVDFRGYGFSSGVPFYTSLITDAMPIYNEFYKWMHKNRLADSLFVFGRSLGSVCASEIGAHNPDGLRGIIFESGFASIYNMMTRLFRVRGPEITLESLSEFSNDTRIKQIKKPVLIIHGTADWIIPSSEGILIHKILPEDLDKSIILIDGAGHNNIFSFRNEYIPPLREFISKYK